jgi:hypothetical protein
VENCLSDLQTCFLEEAEDPDTSTTEEVPGSSENNFQVENYLEDTQTGFLKEAEEKYTLD